MDALFDPVGGDAFAEGFRAVRWGGHALVIGFACGKIPKLPLHLALVKNVTVHGVYWGAHATREPETLARSFRDLARLASEGRLDVSVSHAFPLERAWEAFEALAKRKVVGKVVVTTGAGDGRARAGAGPGGADCDARAWVMFRVRLDGPYIGDMFQCTRPNVNHTACDTS